MRLHQLGMAHERDFDEGVYWESLRLMDGGHLLYREIYDSQPPLFLVTAYPIFEVFGKSIEAARLSSALFSCAGLVGAYLIGRAIAGKLGAVAALVLAVASAAYLQTSQTVQAEASAIGMSWLAVGLTFMAREKSARTRIATSAIAGVALGIALCCKLLAIAAAVPMVLCFVVASREFGANVRGWIAPAVACFAGFVAVVAIVALAFARDASAAFDQIVLLHAGPATAIGSDLIPSLGLLFHSIVSPLGFAAFAGLFLGVRNGDRSVVPVAAWLAATFVVLALLTPLFPHHVVALVPPEIALATMAFAPLAERTWSDISNLAKGLTTCVALCGVLSAIGCVTYFVRDARLQTIPDTLAMDAAVSAVVRFVPAGRTVVTDDDFIAALAGRDTPPWLVDTSFARIHARQLDYADVRRAADASNFGGLLTFSHRLSSLLPAFGSSLAGGFTLSADFGNGRELWTPKR
jgi:4-amino-4-deoxy-L-arabinose transferase-like glycosyltransferase